MANTLDLRTFTLPGLNSQKPLVIAGPCSAETEEQTVATAHELKKRGIQIYRAGIWKPRTRPNNFEGVGTVGLQWLKNVKAETGLYTATEVANVKHVYEALKFDVDVLWIGARTTANPFAVQEIADALSGVDVPVLIKNPVNPDVELWIGALERVNKAGIKRLGAIHRGFSSYGNSIYRNDPQWQIPIEMRRRIPNLPIICDPSHICGSRDLLFEVSQEAMDLNFEGLIIETHLNPDKALSDAKQQVTPDDLVKLLGRLVLRTDNLLEKNADALAGYRKEIDKYDDTIIEMVSKRMAVIEKIGKYKKDNNITILQRARWDEILKNHIKQGETLGLSPALVETIFRALHQESIDRQKSIMNS